MPYKRTPTDPEIDELAARFKPLWRSGEVVRPWLRKHGVMLTGLVHDDWSWASVAAALTRAGITYRTGHPWQAEVLRAEVGKARKPLKGALARAAVIQHATPPAAVVTAPATAGDAGAGAGVGMGADADEPEFKFAKLANWSGTPYAPIKRPQPAPPVEPLPAADVDAVIARLLGRKP